MKLALVLEVAIVTNRPLVELAPLEPRVACNRGSEKREIRIARFRKKSRYREKYFCGGPNQQLKQT